MRAYARIEIEIKMDRNPKLKVVKKPLAGKVARALRPEEDPKRHRRKENRIKIYFQ